MRWTEAMAEVDTLYIWGDTAVSVTGVHYDSRRVMHGDIFVAMRGGTTDGNNFVARALNQGACAVITDSSDKAAELESQGVCVALVSHGRRALAQVSAAVFGHPERKLKLTAVTGTNGKTTTAFLTEQLLQAQGRKCLLLGTIETHVAGEVRASEHTTPESRDVYALMAQAVAAGCTEAVMEFSSHALNQERVWGLPVDVAIFTNLTQDHLDYHGTMDAYAAAKARLFRGVGAPSPRVAVINADDPEHVRMATAAAGSEVRLYGIEHGDWRAESITLRAGETRFAWSTPHGVYEIVSPLTGRVNIYNLVAAMCAAHARGLAMEEIAAAVRSVLQVPGRFQVVDGSSTAGFTVVVDYAHTDDALRNLITLARDLVSPHGGRVITLFGCGGDRDKTKRPKMGRVAAALSDRVIVTSDNPRSEDPMKIIEDALVGVREFNAPYQVEPDRHAAIRSAISAAGRGDIVLIAGKGHEKEQILATGTVPFDDVAEAAAALKEIAR